MDCRQSKIQSEFATDLRLKGRSDATVFHYCKQVRLFLRKIEIPAFQVSARDLKGYISSLYRDRYALNTIKLKIRAVKQFYRFLHSTGRVFLDPADGIKEPAIRRILPKAVLSSSEMNTIRRSIPRTFLVKLRDCAIIEVLFSTGIRLSELQNLNIIDLNLLEGIITIRKGKGGGDRQAILTRDAIKALKKYLNLRRTIPDDSLALWINYFGNRLSEVWIHRMIKEAAKKSGVESPANPHAWRHGLATEMLRRGASIRDIQVFLGHKSIKTTEIYTHLTIRDLVEVHRRTHPREFDYEQQKGREEWTQPVFLN